MIAIHIAVNAIEYNISRSWKRSHNRHTDWFHISDSWGEKDPNSVSWAEWNSVSCSGWSSYLGWEATRK
jgi:hypothetical protein